MIKFALRIVLLLTLGAATGMADTVSVNFASLGAANIPITTAGGYTLDGVNFFYLDGTGLSTASITSTGVLILSNDGSFGTLSLTFSAPVTQSMTFAYAVAPAAAYSSFALVALNNTINQFEASSTDFTGAGTVSFQPVLSPFAVASVSFAPPQGSVVNLIDISSLTYSTVPEPSSLLLLGSGLAGFAGLLRRKLTK